MRLPQRTQGESPVSKGGPLEYVRGHHRRKRSILVQMTSYSGRTTPLRGGSIGKIIASPLSFFFLCTYSEPQILKSPSHPLSTWTPAAPADLKKKRSNPVCFFPSFFFFFKKMTTGNYQSELENSLRQTFLDFMVRKTRESPRFEKYYATQTEVLSILKQDGAAAAAATAQPGWAMTRVLLLLFFFLARSPY